MEERAVSDRVANVAEWNRLKQELRAEDARSVRAGEKRAEDLKRENSCVRPEWARLHLDRSRL